ncbi:non-ribosomal peptide synthetase [Trinickia dinghuensis]|uniref:Non-ribosomal peptide synthetase n=1 Tax=Trinickia dinghuensis TaxID=2291023 RepID=A0A3D8K4H6_9BURK|nr:non-ribosomal peptide synthetase [Trinickia dinghuensis]RDV00219.1 non-ribosomal peptide synthetase [Trinickia dinghuensis]
MKVLPRIALNVVTTLVIALGLTRLLGSIPFAPWATDALIRFAAWFGAYGDERIEDVYAMASLLIALTIAAALVWAFHRLLARRA